MNVALAMTGAITGFDWPEPQWCMRRRGGSTSAMSWAWIVLVAQGDGVEDRIFAGSRDDRHRWKSLCRRRIVTAIIALLNQIDRIVHRFLPVVWSEARAFACGSFERNCHDRKK